MIITLFYYPARLVNVLYHGVHTLLAIVSTPSIGTYPIIAFSRVLITFTSFMTMTYELALRAKVTLAACFGVTVKVLFP